MKTIDNKKFRVEEIWFQKDYLCSVIVFKNREERRTSISILMEKVFKMLFNSLRILD